MSTPALLALEDGSIFKGISIGSDGKTVGEVVFNTSMTGYQEILTDPSYSKQIVTLTYPHIGNTGVNSEDSESNRVWAAGLIIRDLSMITSNWRSENNLSHYLKQHKIVAIADLDTRRLTRILREKGAQRGCIITGTADAEAAIAQAKNTAPLTGLDLAKVVSCQQTHEWLEGSWILGHGFNTLAAKQAKYHVVVYDFGVKKNILRLLVDQGCRLTVVPAQTSAAEALAHKPDGVLLSNGPGDPAACDYAIKATQELLEKKIPLLGICLGFQILVLAAGGKTLKMKFGHHGANHPVQDLRDNKIFITSQNHGFAADEKTLPANIKLTHRSLFDGSLQGLEFSDRPAFGFQGHPEASPGPQDLVPLFEHFIELMK